MEGKFKGLKVPQAEVIAYTDDIKQLVKVFLTFDALYLPKSGSYPPRLLVGLSETKKDGGYVHRHYAAFSNTKQIKELIRVAVTGASYYLRKKGYTPQEVKDTLIPVIRRALEDGIRLTLK